MTYSEMVKHVRDGGKARRPHWTTDQYVTANLVWGLALKTVSGLQKYWSIAAERTAHDWEIA